MKRWQGSLLLVLVLNACTGIAVKESGPVAEQAYQSHAEVLAGIPSWSLVGRISLDDGDRGGSGKLQWHVESENSELDFHGAMGRGAWHLQIGPEGAVLREANGDQQTAPGVNALIQDRIGWSIPVDALQWWVRGLTAPGPIEDLEIGLEKTDIQVQEAKLVWVPVA